MLIQPLYRYLTHFVKLIDAVHILSGVQITKDQLNRARYLLQSFVEEFEQLYGKQNMVFNVHLLLHLVDCVEKNGPIYAYSNYSTEDNIGHLVNFVKGTTDVLSQICDRYLIEKSLHLQLQNSPNAKQFMDKIKYRQFSKLSRVGASMLVGKSNQHSYESVHKWIFDHMRLEIGQKMKTYRAVFINSKLYFETADLKSAKKLTYDSFVCIPNDNIYGEINLIFEAENEVFFVVNNIFQIKNQDSDISSSFIKELEEKTNPNLVIIKSSNICSKYVLMKTTKVTCAPFPNIYERN